MDPYAAMLLAFLFGQIGWLIQYLKKQGDDQKARRVADTYALYAQYESDAMLTARLHVFTEHIAKGEEKPRDIRDVWTKDGAEAVTSILRVANFFERLDRLRNEGQIDEKTAVRLFSRSYAAWYDVYLRHQVEYTRGDARWEISAYAWLLADVGPHAIGRQPQVA